MLPVAVTLSGPYLLGFIDSQLCGIGLDDGSLFSLREEDVIGVANDDPAAAFVGVQLRVGFTGQLAAAERRIRPIKPRGELFVPPEGFVSGYPQARLVIEAFRSQVPHLDAIRHSAVFAGMTIRTGIETAEWAYECLVEQYRKSGGFPPVEEIRGCIRQLGFPKLREPMYREIQAWSFVCQQAIQRGLRDRELRRYLFLETQMPRGISLAKLSFTLALLGQNLVCLDARLIGKMRIRDDWSDGNTKLNLARYERAEDAFLKGNPNYDPADPLGAARAQWISWEVSPGRGRAVKPTSHSVWLDIAGSLIRGQGKPRLKLVTEAGEKTVEILPSTHVPGMIIDKKRGARCTTCKFYGGGRVCNNQFFIASGWPATKYGPAKPEGSNIIPYDPDAYCSDFYDKKVAGVEEASPERHDPFRHFAASFLAGVYYDDASEAREFYDNPLSLQIASALRRIPKGILGGFEPRTILGSGDYGTAALLSDYKRVIKLTSDPTEVAAGAVLTGKQLVHVAQIYGSWYLSRTSVDARFGWDEQKQDEIRKKVRVGVLILEKVQADIPWQLFATSGPRRELLGKYIRDFKEREEVRVEDLAKLTKKAARDRLHHASEMLSLELENIDNPIFNQIAEGLEELREQGVYGIDVHPGNIGYIGMIEEPGAYTIKIFDVGSSSSPEGTKVPSLRATPAPEVVAGEKVRVAELV